MRTEPDFLAAARESLKARVPERAFLRLDRADALFITNAPAIDPGFTDVPGFTVERRGTLAALYPQAPQLCAFEQLYPEPLGALSESVFRFAALPATPEALSLFSKGLKLLAAPAVSAVQAYDREVRRYVAVALRTRDPGGVYAVALLADLALSIR